MELRKLLRYEPETGKLFWLERSRELFQTDRSHATWNSRYANGEAFTNTIPGGYRTGTIHNRSYRAHIVAWAIATGEWPSSEIDHLNGVRDDNRLHNLRLATSGQNKRNCRRYANNTSGYTGVHWEPRRKRWIVLIRTKEGKTRQCGSFVDKAEAAAARQRLNPQHGYSLRHGATS
jgi:hypothetical protein